jgi:hypothetical protein
MKREQRFDHLIIERLSIRDIFEEHPRAADSTSFDRAT